MGIAESHGRHGGGPCHDRQDPVREHVHRFSDHAGPHFRTREVCYGNLNVKFGGAYCGMSDALDGATHHATEDIAVMRSLPNMTVLVPSDATSTRWATKYAVDTYGPMYLRLSRDVYRTCMTRTRSSSAAKRRHRARRHGRDRHRLRHPRAQGARGGRADGCARACPSAWWTCTPSSPSTASLSCAARRRPAPSSPPRSTTSTAASAAPWRKCSPGAARPTEVCRHPRHVHRDRQVHRPARQARRGCSRCRARHRAGARAQALSFLHGSRQAERLPAFSEEDHAAILCPGRTELAGNHTDHQLGRVLAASVDVGITARAGDCRACIPLEGVPAVHRRARRSGRGPTRVGSRGRSYAAWRRAILDAGGAVGGFEAWASSALSRAAACRPRPRLRSLSAAFSTRSTMAARSRPEQLARFGQQAENRHFGKPSGLMDQLAVRARRRGVYRLLPPGRSPRSRRRLPTWVSRSA